MPLMDGVPSRPERAGPAKVIATAIAVLARAVVPARHSCESRNRSAPLWIPAFAGMTASRDDGEQGRRRAGMTVVCSWRRRIRGAVRYR